MVVAACQGETAAPAVHRTDSSVSGGANSNAVSLDLHILVDQFGYRPADPKVAVIRDPKVGFDAADTFSPGSTYQLRRADDGSVLAALIRARNEEGTGGLTAQELRDEVREILTLFGDRLSNRLDHPAYSLSYANRRRVEIARALALRPRLLLLDEPTAGMNPTETAEMQGLIASLKARGTTILLIEHKLEMVMQLSDRVYVLDDGAKIAEGSPQSVRNDPAVIEAYLGHSDLGQAKTPPVETPTAGSRAWA